MSTRPRPCLRVHPIPRPEDCKFCWRFVYSPRHRAQWQGEGPALPVPAYRRPARAAWAKTNVRYCAPRGVWDWTVLVGGRAVESGSEPTEAKARAEAAAALAARPEARTVRVRFTHGLGDATNFAHMLPLFARRGYAVEVECRADEAPVFRAGGAAVVPGPAAEHKWTHAPMDRLPPWPDPWVRNKNAWNLLGPEHPMPQLGGGPAELWKEYAAVRLDFGPQVTDADRKTADDLLAGAPRPWVCFHQKGFQWGDYRNYPDDWAVELWRKLAAATGGTVVVLDRDERAARCPDPAVRYLKYFQPGQMYEVMRRCDVMVGIDSGPLNFVRFTDVPAVGIWNAHYPADYFLPRDNTVHVVAARHAARDRYEREHWNTVLCPDDGPSPDFLAKTIRRVLAGPRYLPGGPVARDVQLQAYMDRTDSAFRHDFGNRVDRHESFGRALAFLATRERPTLVETGCIRSEDDWAGAGFSTYLFGAFLARHGGTLASVDLTPEYVAFARTWTREFGCVTVHEGHSHRFLESYAGPPIDLFFADSCDTSEPEHQDCCLGEVRRALPHLAPGARILIDDTPPAPGGGWQGKGGKAVPWLLGRGWRLEWSGWQAILAPPA